MGAGPVVLTRVEDDLTLPFAVWTTTEPWLVLSSAPVGGGLGPRRWIINAQVRSGYARTDLDVHLAELALATGTRAGSRLAPGAGVGLLTAADVGAMASASDAGVWVDATVGVRVPTWAAAPSSTDPVEVGTINVVAFVPVRLSDAALVNAVTTMTEAKTQALLDVGIEGTGTATDAVCVACPLDDRDGEARFAGPRSEWGARLARATFAAVRAGTGVHP
jgi:adenosylcobinamide hydrolase